MSCFEPQKSKRGCIVSVNTCRDTMQLFLVFPSDFDNEIILEHAHSKKDFFLFEKQEISTRITNVTKLV